MALPNLTKAAVHRKNGDDSAAESPVPEKPEMSKAFPIVATPRQAKHWAKQYRTEIAAGSSSILSTFSAVSLESTQSDWTEGKILMSPAVSLGFRQNPNASVRIALLSMT